MNNPKPNDIYAPLLKRLPKASEALGCAPSGASSADDDRWVWFEDEYGEPFRVPRSWVRPDDSVPDMEGNPHKGTDQEDREDGDDAGPSGMRIKNPTLADMFEGVRLTDGQAALIPKLQAFLDDDKARIFLLRGYAGTGKTFLMKGVVRYLEELHRTACLMAPTGRAAKVLSTRTNKPASTIHSHLYAPRDEHDPDDEDFCLVSDLSSNTDDLNAVYIVDEGSMVSDRETENPLLQFGSGRLLTDLLHFLEDSPGAHRRHLVFVGDTAQLPPVGMNVSPALSADYLDEAFGMRPDVHTLTDIVRQKKDSAILELATQLRTGLREGVYAIPKLPEGAPDVERIASRDMARLCWEAMGRRVTKSAIMIAQTNARVQHLNRAFRQLQFPGVETLAAGDRLMVILNTRLQGEFICNGDFCQVKRAGRTEERRVTVRLRSGPSGKSIRTETVDLRFQTVALRLRGNSGELFDVSCRILLNQLEPDNLPDTSLLFRALMADFKIRHPDLRHGTKAWQDEIAEDPYVNALHVRYGYAVTCHKSQGGEWAHVFVDCASAGPRSMPGYFRWLYTAVTRAKTKLHLANYPRHAYDDPNELLPVRDGAWPEHWQSELPARHPGEDPDALDLELPRIE